MKKMDRGALQEMFYRFSLEPRLFRAGAGAVEGACKGAVAGHARAKQAFKTPGRNQEALATMVAFSRVKEMRGARRKKRTASSSKDAARFV